MEDVERFAGLLATRDWHDKLGWKHHYLAWRVVVRWVKLGAGPGCDVHEKAIKGVCSLRLPEGGINHDKGGGNTMSENSRLAQAILSQLAYIVLCLLAYPGSPASALLALFSPSPSRCAARRCR